MRILQVVHQFPPFSSQGSEVHVLQLARSLSPRDDVRVFHVSNTSRRLLRRLDEGRYDDIQTYHCIDGREYARTAGWRNHYLRAQFEKTLEDFTPHIVHFHNYLSLGDDLITIARGHRARTVYTLHDYGLICPNALLRTTDGRLCEKHDADFFQDCCPDYVRARGVMPAAVLSQIPPLIRWRMLAAQHRPGMIGTILRAGVAVAGRGSGDVATKRESFLARTRQIFRDVDLFVSPSMFLLERYVQCGLPATKIVHEPLGLPLLPRAPGRTPGGRVTFGFIGAIHPHKGLELLIDAFRGLEEVADLHVHGSVFGSPVSEAYRQKISEGAGSSTRFFGPYERSALGRILGSLDVVVVPSLWYENSPLVIQEAFSAGVPVITADQGGMAELVRHDVNGLLFRLGDAAALRTMLRRVIDEPRILDRLRANIPAIPDVDSQAARTRARYESLLKQVGY